LYASPPIRGRAIASLARIDRKTHIADLLTALHAQDSNEDEVATATAQLQRISGGVPDRKSALEYLVMDFHNTQDKARLIDNDDQMIALWTINDDRSGVTFLPSRRMIAAYRDIVDAGSRLRRLGGLPPDVNSEVLSADMAYRVIIDIDWGDPDQIKSIRDAYGATASGAELSDAITVAIAADDHAAAIGLIRLVEPDASELDRDLFLHGNGALPTPLVQAASSPNPRVRYEAALAVARLAGGAPFAGSSQVKQSLGEMRSLGDQPSAILVETRADLIIPLENLLSDLGYQVDVVGSVAQLQRRVARGGDIRMILSKTELSDLPPIEMLDLVRRTDRGRDIPILFYGWQPPGIDHGRWRAPTVLIERPASTAAFDGLLDTVERKRRLPAMSVIDRQSFRAAATAMLSELAQTP
jgi:CheY-like chemotaxis protein